MIYNDSVSGQENDVIGVNPGQTETLREARLNSSTGCTDTQLQG